MSIFTTRPALRWLVPAAVAATVIGGGAAVRTLTADASPSLPPRTAAQLLVDLQTARLDGLSGTVVQTADLGIPALPMGGGQGSSDLSSLVSGSHTLRVWYAGPDSARIALLGTLGESDVIRVGRDVWTWSSGSNTATHRVLPAENGREHAPIDPQSLPKTPQEAADAALAAIDPTTKVTTGSAARVAGRPAYELILQPRDTASLIGQVRIAIDAEQHVPLRVQVYPAKSDATAIEVKFTQVSFARPDAAQFRFAPPPGAKVTEESGEPPAGAPNASQAPQYALVGKGWTSVLVARAPADAPKAGAPKGGDQRPGQGFSLDRLPAVSGSWGSGHVLTGKLFSVLLTDDGRLLVGAVSPDALFRAASDPAAALKASK
jgi:outer membrane lipoprotein-sorting protein